MTEHSWPVPEISDVELVFPANVLEWAPPMEEIPDEFKDGSSEWCKIASSWFAIGLPDDVEFYAREGIPAETAFRAVGALLRSYAPRHQHKNAAAGFLLSCWFERIEKWQGGRTLKVDA